MVSYICDLIKSNKDWRDVISKLHIKIAEDGELAVFKYNMLNKLESGDIELPDFSNPIVQEARGIIINTKTAKVVAYPFRKFGNYGEYYADKIDWSSARVQEKIDGSIMKLYFYNGVWCLATNGTINAYSCENPYGKNFGDMAAKALADQNLDFSILNPDYTYIFELSSPDNQIVVKYDKTLMYHIGTRSNVTGEEFDIDIGIVKPKEYELHSLEDCIAFANTLDGISHEGFVVVDKNWNRIKVKGEDYMKLHYLAGNSTLSVKNAISIILSGEWVEYCSYFPVHKEKLEKFKSIIDETLLEIEEFIDKVKAENLSKKDYALKYSNHKFFHFGIEVIYLDKKLEVSEQYWLKIIKKGE